MLVGWKEKVSKSMDGMGWEVTANQFNGSLQACGGQ